MSVRASLLQGDFPEKYNWSVEYEVGVPLIDAQHKKLFLIFKNLIHARKGQGGGQAVMQALELMTDYMDYHFKAEEMFWECDPEVYGIHRKAHYTFVRKVYKTTGKIHKKEDVSEEILQFLGNWLVEHVLGMDRDHFQLLRDKGVVDPDGFLAH
jgi:hemerythrin